VNAAPLVGRRVVTTREQRGELDALLTAAGAEVVHVPLIEIADDDETRAAVRAAADVLADHDWLIVTSRHGARRMGRAAAAHGHLRLAAVGTATAAELADLAGRPVEVVPDRQTAAHLVDAMPAPASGSERVLVGLADRAAPTLVDGLTRRGYRVTAVTAYRTRLRRPSATERAAALGADAVGFASGSAAIAWAQAIGSDTPAVVVAIGPTTADVARRSGLAVTHVADDHSVAGLAACISRALASPP